MTVKRTSVSLPALMYDDLKAEARRLDTTISDVIRRYVRAGKLRDDFSNVQMPLVLSHHRNRRFFEMSLIHHQAVPIVGATTPPIISRLTEY